MKRYERYKDSGIPWIGEIPEHWEVKKIKRLSVVKRGASPRPIHDPIYFDMEGEWSWVRIADVSASDHYLESTSQTLSEYGASLSVKMTPGDFFLSIAGTVGKPIITKIKCCIHDGFVYFPYLNIDPEYLYYIFSTGMPYQGLGKWGTQLNLNTDTVGEISIPVPDEFAIKNIVIYLNKKTAEINKLISQKKRLLELYEEEKRAIINQAVTKGIDPDVPMKYSGIPWLGEIPEHWEVKKLKYIGESIIGLTYSPDEVVNDCGTLVLRSSNIQNGKLSLKDCIFVDKDIPEKLKVKEGDILICSRNGSRALIGKNITITKELEGNTFGAFMTVFRTKYYKFVSKYFNSQVFNGQSGLFLTSTVNQLTIHTLNNFFIAIPPKDERDEIVKYIEDKLKIIDKKIEKTKKIIELQKEYRTALISEVVTGKIKVVEDEI